MIKTGIIRILLKDRQGIEKYSPREYDSYEYDRKCFLIYREGVLVALYNLDVIEIIDIEFIK